MKTVVRTFSSSGIQALSAWLQQPDERVRASLLNDDLLSETVAEGYVVDLGRKFETSYELGLYLSNEVFTDAPDRRELLGRSGMWSWLSLAFMDSLTSRRDQRPLGVAHYVDTPKWWYRLIVRTAWDLVTLYGEAAKVALGSKRSPWGEMAEQMTATQEVYANRSFWPVAYRLYANADGSVKRGATTQRPRKARKDPRSTSGLGGVRRLPTTYKQFDRTYNLRVMQPDQVLELLPAEYHRWLRESTDS